MTSARRGEPKRAARLFGTAEVLGEAASVTVAFPPALVHQTALENPARSLRTWEEHEQAGCPLKGG